MTDLLTTLPNLLSLSPPPDHLSSPVTRPGHVSSRLTDLPTVILEPAVSSLQYSAGAAALPVDCLVTDSAPLASVTWIKVGQTSIYSTETRIMVGTDNTGEFLCTALNSVGPSLTASLSVEIKGLYPRLCLSEVNIFSL